MSPIYWTVVFVTTFTVLWMTLKLWRKFIGVKINFTRHHKWSSAEFASRPTYCNSCQDFCISGSVCEICDICACSNDGCLQLISNHFTCKPLSSASTGHFWVLGNLPLDSQCTVCHSPCGTTPALVDYKCSYCHVTVHEDCTDGTVECSMGPHRRLIIPPSSVGLKKQNWRGEEKVAVTTIAPPNLLGWRPLIVLSNTKSGGKDGHIVMSSLRKLLNPIQVIDLHKTTPEKALDMYCSVFSLPVRILVCGGDGTVGWVLSAIDKSKLSVKPHVGILPLGTGNDLARVLGWGPGYSPRSDDMSEILKEVEHSQLSVLDRWQVRIQSEKQYFKLKRTITKVHVMNNYIGIGCDAGVALNFHRRRESYPELFASRLINKAWYLIFGAQDFMIPTCSDLTNKIRLYIDGALQELPNLEGIVVLNINSWSSGCPMWSSNGEWGPSRMDDRMLEVVGLYSSFHVGRIQISASEPVRIGQSSNVKIVINESVPVHIDGEPWEQSGPSVIDINHQGQAYMLKKV